MIFSAVNFIYQFTERPQVSRMEYFIECINELTILLFSYLLNVILNSAIPINFKYEIGWLVIAISCINVLLNVMIIMSKQVHD